MAHNKSSRIMSRSLSLPFPKKIDDQVHNLGGALEHRFSPRGGGVGLNELIFKSLHPWRVARGRGEGGKLMLRNDRRIRSTSPLVERTQV